MEGRQPLSDVSDVWGDMFCVLVVKAGIALSTYHSTLAHPAADLPTSFLARTGPEGLGQHMLKACLFSCCVSTLASHIRGPVVWIGSNSRATVQPPSWGCAYSVYSVVW